MDTELAYREIMSTLARHLPMARVLDLPFDPMPHWVMQQLGEWARDAESRGDEAECRQVFEAVAAAWKGNEVRLRAFVVSFLREYSPHPDSPMCSWLPDSLAVLLEELERVPDDLAPLLPREPRVAMRCNFHEHFFVPMLRSFRFLVDDHGFRLVEVRSFGGDLSLRFERGEHRFSLFTQWENCSITARWIYGLPRFLATFNPIERAGVSRSNWTIERVKRDQIVGEELERRRLLRFCVYVERAARGIEKDCGAWIEELELRSPDRLIDVFHALGESGIVEHVSATNQANPVR